MWRRLPSEPYWDSRRKTTIQELLVATNNAGKLREYRAILSGLPLALLSLAERGIAVEVEETGATFAENASLKARAYADLSGLLTLADDSGLEVDALSGEPGVRSARYAGEGASDADRYNLLLARLRDVPWERRQARFRCAIAIAEPRGDVAIAEGCVDGYIAFAPQGSGGFGYDPVFFLPDRGCTMAELPEADKNRLSHRARAGEVARQLLFARHARPSGDAIGEGP